MSDNLRVKWERAAGHMQAAARRQQGFAVVTMEILVDASGDPVMWFEPCVRKIGPLIESKEFMRKVIADAQQDFG